MKKQYMAPAFTPVKMLMASAAGGGCDVQVASWGYQSCAVSIEFFGNVFTDSNVDCEYEAEQLQEIGLFCFGTQAPNSTVFGS